MQVLGFIGERVFPQYGMSDSREGDSVRHDLRCARGGSDRFSFIWFQSAGVFAVTDRHSQPFVWRDGMGLVLSVCKPGLGGCSLHDAGLA